MYIFSADIFVILVEEKNVRVKLALLFNFFGICFICMVLCRISLVQKNKTKKTCVQNFMMDSLCLFFFPVCLLFFWHYGKCLNSMAFNIDPMLVLMLHD